MSTGDAEVQGPRSLTANVKLAIGTQALDLKLVVPDEEVPPDTLLPVLQTLANTVVDGVEQDAADHGVEISCKKGCGACCRQPVPVSQAEARMLAQVVEDMPEPRRSEVKARFEAALEHLREAGLFERTVNFHSFGREERLDTVRAYFSLGIPCPFLEEESCSIYADRPLVCREYVVVSSPRHCAKLDGSKIMRLPLPASIFSTFSKMEGVNRTGDSPYMPLIAALEWVDEHGQDCETRPGPKWIQQFFERLSGAAIPDPDSADTMMG